MSFMTGKTGVNMLCLKSVRLERICHIYDLSQIRLETIFHI